MDGAFLKTVIDELGGFLFISDHYAVADFGIGDMGSSPGRHLGRGGTGHPHKERKWER